ncbi:DNA-binding transcriptional regulator CsiR [Marinomonas algarum]|uniref:DNA-binding transcriptional regulator CsiR n=1 Tax=Marinomonas algarum TaxID=2883105 RepID=A0A9X1INI3_9GAMM|nr:DNA-binding transcriptional regulator CsiR [Marinomonas algarum]MCB5162395.1 DNA-binding transcriptional regulator CsiR [Marinomonas algarum]
MKSNESISVDSKDNSASQVLGALTHDILTGYFQPGEKLRMTRLKERYEVGVGPLREALSQLLVKQLVIVENQRGFRVHPISKAELVDIYETRAEIEALCTRFAIERGGDEWEANIVACAHKMKLHADQLEKEPHTWEQYHHDFHTAIAEGCRSSALLQVRADLYEKASRYRNLWLKKNMIDLAVFDANKKEHEALVSALLKRDVETATDLIRQHILSPSVILQATAVIDTSM